MNTKISEVQNKLSDNSNYITTKELTAEKFSTRLKQADLVSETDFDNKLTGFNRKITLNKTKNVEVQKNLDSIATNDCNFFLGKIMLQVMMDLKTRFFINHNLML